MQTYSAIIPAQGLNMMDFTTCFVALNKDNEFKYVSHKMSGYRYPIHTRKDIMDMCSVMNSIATNNLRYVDVFHVLDASGSTVWIESMDAEKAHQEFRPVLTD